MTTNISLFRNIRDTKPFQVADFFEIMDHIQGGLWSDEVGRVRSASNKATKNDLKKSIPCFTGSGQFKSRKADDLIKHSGLVIIDIDHVEPYYTKNLFKNDQGEIVDPFIAAIFTSVGGEGLAVAVRIDPKKHEASYPAVIDYLVDMYEVPREKIDAQCKDLPRARFVSFDPDAYINPDVQEFVVVEQPQLTDKPGKQPDGDVISKQQLALFKKQSTPTRGIVAKMPTNPDEYTPERCTHIVTETIRKATDGHRHQARRSAAILAGGFIAGGILDEATIVEVMEQDLHGRGITGQSLQTALQTIQDGVSYGKRTPITQENAPKKMAEIETKRVQGRKLFDVLLSMIKAGRDLTRCHEDELDMIAQECEVNIDDVREKALKMAQEFEHMLGWDDLPPYNKMKRFLEKSYEFKRNVVTNEVWATRTDTERPEWSVLNHNDLLIRLWDYGINIQENKLTTWLASDEVPEFNPFGDFFAGLPGWPKGGDSAIERLAGYIKTDNDDFFVPMFKKAIVRMVKCVLEDNYVNRMVVVFKSTKQGTGKSTFIRWLNPFEDGAYFREDALTFDKDTSLAMAETMIYNLDELSALSKRSITQLKQWISKSRISERRPYAKVATKMPRRCTFWGSTNDDTFLTDRENTRWLIFDLKEIDFNYSKDFDVRTIYAEAYSLYKEGFDVELTLEERNIQEEANKGFEVQSYEESLLVSNFMKSKEGAPLAKFYSFSDIKDILDNMDDGRKNTDKAALQSALSKVFGATEQRRINKQRIRGRWLEQVSNAQVETQSDQEPLY